MDPASVRARLQSARGQEYWRSLDELAGTKEYQEFLHNEFPRLTSGWWDSINRRDILKLMGASLALAGLTACTRQPPEKIVPYVRSPEDLVPGKPLFYATAMPLAGYARGLLVESHLGRPTKIEGNPQHPASHGATDAFSQASVLTLYDPDRAQAVSHNGRIGSWVFFLAAISEARKAQHLKKGAGLRLLTETVTSPTLASQIKDLLTEFPLAKWHQYEPMGGDSARGGAHLAFGEYVDTIYHLDKADVILALDSDFLSSGHGHLRYARDWASRRKGETGRMNRLYSVESSPSNTGAVADHVLRMKASEVETFARAIAKELGVGVETVGALSPPTAWLTALVKDLKAHRGSSLVIAGECQSSRLHALAHAMNQMLGNVGNTVVYTDPVEANPVDQVLSLTELVSDMKAGAVDVLVILGGNPVYTAPADLQFAENLSKVGLRIHLSQYLDETALLCHWHVPECHYLESWGDVRAYDGTISIIQPLIAPLYDAKSAHEVMSILVGKAGVPGHDIVKSYWKSRNPAGNFEEFWQTSLHDGFIRDSALPPKPVTLKVNWNDQATWARAHGPSNEIEIIFRPDPTIFDGSFANNGWLQELPKPLTKLTWDNAVLISPAIAQRLQLRSREVVEIRYRGRSVRAPVWILPGHNPDSITVHLGYGRTQTGRVGTGAGFNAYSLRTSDSLWYGSGVELHRTGATAVLACTQNQNLMEGRNLVRVGTVEEYGKNPHFVQEMGEEPAPDDTLYPGFDYSKGYQWGMSINLGSCIGCNACVVACQSENNIPVVGKTEVDRGRAMHWIRVDRYYRGNPDEPSTCFQPVLCMHCENAPCELVCPVAATNHSSEGLNQMVYNRCVGTKYCSNNCPYKVRRFNFLQYSDWDTPSLKPLRNPDVTVRGRGVMEKCTYCIQRISRAKIEAEKEDREVRDGEIITACQAVCPTNAIVFGNINEKESQVARAKASPLNYGVLAELNTRPRTTYLAKLRNPNPEIEKE